MIIGIRFSNGRINGPSRICRSVFSPEEFCTRTFVLLDREAGAVRMEEGGCENSHENDASPDPIELRVRMNRRLRHPVRKLHPPSASRRLQHQFRLSKTQWRIKRGPSRLRPPPPPTLGDGLTSSLTVM